ncbi:MAG: hypothetical protein R3B13_34215 [Polyangiaceae bacterium]
MRLRAAWSLHSCCALFASVANGQEIQQCVAAHESAQREEKAERLLRARELYAQCSAAACPDLVRNECARLGKELIRRIPSIRVRVIGATGPVVLEIDEQDWASIPDSPIAVDPGTRVVRVTPKGGTTLVRELEIEASSSEDVQFDLRPRAAPPDDQKPSRKGLPTAAYVAGGVGLLGFAGFAGFGLAGRSKQDELDACKGSCTDHGLYDDMKANYLVADISLGVGLAATALAVYFVVDSSSGDAAAEEARPKPRRHPWLALGAKPGFAELHLGGNF